MKKSTRILIPSFILLAAILGYLYLAAQSYVIHCTKDDPAQQYSGAPVCELRNTLGGVVTLSKRTVNAPVIVRTAEQCQDNACLYRIELYDNQGGVFPVNVQYTTGREPKARITTLLNEFIYDPLQTEISLREQVDWMVYSLPLAMIGLFVIYLVSVNQPKRKSKS